VVFLVQGRAAFLAAGAAAAAFGVVGGVCVQDSDCLRSWIWGNFLVELHLPGTGHYLAPALKATLAKRRVRGTALFGGIPRWTGFMLTETVDFP